MGNLDFVSWRKPGSFAPSPSQFFALSLFIPFIHPLPSASKVVLRTRPYDFSACGGSHTFNILKNVVAFFQSPEIFVYKIVYDFYYKNNFLTNQLSFLK